MEGWVGDVRDGAFPASRFQVDDKRGVWKIGDGRRSPCGEGKERICMF